MFEVGEANFSLHKFMLVAKSGLITKKIMELKEANLTKIDLSGIPVGAEIFETVAKFCYDVNFKINVKNVAALRCAAKYLEMIEKYCQDNLAGQTDDFLPHAALNTLSATKNFKIFYKNLWTALFVENYKPMASAQNRLAVAVQ
ncbi:root phototropism protein 2-like, partial [Telopea speciosissima]|uniref:root phototropism protein 2-like n=1 Tax=Telopea speciosissima TaxID=54955 RepID=UPI001CC50E1C